MLVPKRFKYIIIEDMYGNETPIIFPQCIVHSSFKSIFPHIVSAGQGDIAVLGDVLTICCFGESTSLNLVSRPKQDEQLILKMITKEI